METLDSTEACIDAVLARVGRRVLVAAPLGIGKPNHLLNALYRRAKADHRIELTIFTALSLVKPTGRSELERRFLGPMVERVFAGYPDLDYELDRRAGKLPQNVRVIEFYVPAGAYMDVPVAQRDYVSANYTHVARDLHARGVNVLMQQVCAGVVHGRPRLSLSCNPDLSLDLATKLRADEKQGRAIAIVGQINDQLPFMYGEAVVSPEVFDYLVDDATQSFPLYAPPKLSVSDADHMIGLYASTLVRDGGELQIGIGALGDAVVSALLLRQQQNDLYQDVLHTLGVDTRAGAAIADMGHTGRFEKGLFAASEMLVDGFMHLFEAGILSRKVYDDVAISRLRNEGRIDEQVTPELLDLLRGRKAIHSVLTEEDIGYLQHFGILDDALRWEDGMVVDARGERFVANLDEPAARARLNAALGSQLDHGAVIHAGFFVGSRAFYDWLRGLPEDRRRLIDMRSVTKINQLYGHEELDRLHRRNARFINTTMMVTLLGAAVSDALEDGRVVSGVGGQYNFVAMAHELPAGRSVLQVRSTRREQGQERSNIVWSYGHVTIPRHLRDVVITEYGIADLRGKTDEECIQGLLCIADSRFQPQLMADAKRRGKLRADHVIPEAHRHNLPDGYQKPMAALRARGLFAAFPFGTELTPEEQRLGRALRKLSAALQTPAGMLQLLGGVVRKGAPGPDILPLLKRMQLDAPRTARERMFQRLVAAALRDA